MLSYDDDNDDDSRIGFGGVRTVLQHSLAVLLSFNFPSPFAMREGDAI